MTEEIKTAREDSFLEDEVLILDTRARLTPTEMVERKLVSLLKDVPLPVSHSSAPRLQRRSC